MKYLKFRSISHGLLAVGMLFFFITSCDRDEPLDNDATAVIQEEEGLNLSEDSDYQKLESLNDELQTEISSVLAAKGISEEEFQEMSANNDEAKFNEVFGNSNIAQIMSEVSPVSVQLIDRYGEVSEVESRGIFDDWFRPNRDEKTKEKCMSEWRARSRAIISEYQRCNAQTRSNPVCNMRYTAAIRSSYYIGQACLRDADD